MYRFRDRTDAGIQLARELAHLGQSTASVVLALPRGGVPVAFEVARSLGIPLDVFEVRKLGVPGHEELAMGAVASGGVRFLNQDVIAAHRIPTEVLEQVTARELRRIQQQHERYGAGSRTVNVAGRAVIVVDDGLATGATMHAAVAALRKLGAARITVAVPVGARETCGELRRVADDVVCLIAPVDFRAVGLWYEDFGEVSDDEVRSLLLAAETPESGPVGEREVEIAAGDATLRATLAIPADARGLIIFAHGSGSSRHSPRNRYVAETLRNANFATLLLDLLTAAEEQEDRTMGHLRFDIGLLASRLAAASSWAAAERETANLPQGYFGASTGAAAALLAAAEQSTGDADGTRIAAIVSRGGRPDLAGDALERVSAPTLLIVGSLDREVLEVNRRAQSRMKCPVELAVVPGATHLFEEPGALDRVASLAVAWFERHPG